MSEKTPTPPGSRLKTYSHLAGQRRMPNDYELVTTDLLYYTRHGLAVDVPLKRWYAQHQAGSPLRASEPGVPGPFDRFVDPRQTTYTSYTALQQQREGFVDGILQSIEDQGYDRRLSDASCALLERVLGPARYLGHGLQMLAAYVGSMAPSGRITLCALFQTADEVRRIQRLAYRLRQLQLTHPDFGQQSRTVWQGDSAWQPLRRSVERLLVTYDWGEALVALNLSLKPLCDEALYRFAEAAAGHGDVLWREIWRSLREDSLWQRAWTAALFQTLFADRPENRQVVQGWLDAWQPLHLLAAAALAGTWEDVGAATEALGSFHRDLLMPLGLVPRRQEP